MKRRRMFHIISRLQKLPLTMLYVKHGGNGSSWSETDTKKNTVIFLFLNRLLKKQKWARSFLIMKIVTTRKFQNMQDLLTRKTKASII